MMKCNCTMTIVAQLALAIGGLFVSASALWAQPAQFRIAVLTPGLTFEPVFLGFKEGLERHGYGPGKVDFMVEDTKGSVTDLPGRVATLLKAKPDLIFTAGTALSLAAKKATSTVPIVFAAVADPVRSGLIAEYQSSRNNLTGISSYAGPMSGKRLEVFNQIAPMVKRLLVIIPSKEVIAQVSLPFLEEAAKRLNIQIVRHEVATKADISDALMKTAKGSVQGIFLLPSILVSSHVDVLIKKAIEDRIPFFVHEASYVEQGALASYGGDLRLTGVQLSRLVAKVLKGEKPSNIPTETPEKFLLVVNAATAKTIGLKIPSAVAGKVDHMVE